MATHIRHLTRILAAVAVVLASALGSARVQADAASEARQRYERAIKFYEEGVYDAALVELTRAYELNPSFRIVYNIAQTRLAMRDYAGAIEAFQRYLREGGGKVPNDRVASVRAQLDDLQQRVGKLTIETDVPDSEVLIDDVVVGNAPLTSPLAVNAGMRRVTVRHPDFPTQNQRVSVAGGEQLRVTLYLRPRGAEAPPAVVAPKETSEEAVAVPAPPPPESAPHRALSVEAQADGDDGKPSKALAIVATGATVALATTAVVLGVVTANKDADLDAKRAQPERQDRAAFDDERSSLRTLATLTDAFAVATIAAAGVTVWLWLSDAEPSETARAGAATPVRVSLGPTGARLRGEF